MIVSPKQGKSKRSFVSNTLYSAYPQFRLDTIYSVCNNLPGYPCD